jgi:hypothetical protein
MQVSSKPKTQLRSKIGRVATAVAFALVICSFGVGPARAADDHGNDRGRGGGEHHDGGDRGRGPNIYYAPQPDYYYAPAPDYYVAPEPYYYGDEPQYVAPPPQGISLFFGL